MNNGQACVAQTRILASRKRYDEVVALTESPPGDDAPTIIRKIMAEMLDGVEVPAGLSASEVVSLLASWINEVCYASIEKPNVGEGSADFDIHYCPHEDVYGAFDCRVQRYYVEGITMGSVKG